MKISADLYLPTGNAIDSAAQDSVMIYKAMSKVSRWEVGCSERRWVEGDAATLPVGRLSELSGIRGSTTIEDEIFLPQAPTSRQFLRGFDCTPNYFALGHTWSLVNGATSGTISKL